MRSFPSIEQFRNVVREVRLRAAYLGRDEEDKPIYSQTATYPTLKYKGSIKLHGTNGGIVFENNTIVFQSRDRELSEEDDNFSFCKSLQPHAAYLNAAAERIKQQVGAVPAESDYVAIYGEWCGGSLERGVAIRGLPMMFVVNSIRVNDVWHDIDNFSWLTNPQAGIYNSSQFPQYEIEIDFAWPELAQNKLAELTAQVEAQCPVGNYFGKQGVGEGIVWRCASDTSSKLWFKVKGPKHSATKVKTLASVDVEKVASIREFVEATVTLSRLEQGLKNLTQEKQLAFNKENLGEFIRWVFRDIVKEEADTIAESGFDAKDLGSPVAVAAKRWYLTRLEEPQT